MFGDYNARLQGFTMKDIEGGSEEDTLAPLASTAGQANMGKALYNLLYRTFFLEVHVAFVLILCFLEQVCLGNKWFALVNYLINGLGFTKGSNGFFQLLITDEFIEVL